MAGRKYHRNRHGQFASAGAGTHVTFGKAGGFANASHRAAVQKKVSRRALRRKILVRGGVAAGAVAYVGLSAALSKNAHNRHFNTSNARRAAGTASAIRTINRTMG